MRVWAIYNDRIKYTWEDNECGITIQLFYVVVDGKFHSWADRTDLEWEVRTVDAPDKPMQFRFFYDWVLFVKENLC